MESVGASDTRGAAADWKDDHHSNRLWHKPDPQGWLDYEDVLLAFIFFLQMLHWHVKLSIPTDA